MLTVNAYIDLNLVAAGLAATPESSPHTSIKERVAHVEKQGRLEDVRAALYDSVSASRAASGLEDSLWLVPIEDRRRLGSEREGMLEGFTLGNYLMLVEYTGRVVREGKASIAAELADVFVRLGFSADAWQARLLKLSGGRLLGRFLSAQRDRLRQVACKLGVHHLANLGGSPAA